MSSTGNSQASQANREEQQGYTPTQTHELTIEEVDALWKLEKTEPTTPLYQGSELLDGTIKLPVLENKLTGEANWLQWRHEVKGILTTKSLVALINDERNMRKPAPTDPSAKQWKKASHTVKVWLVQSLSVKMRAEINGKEDELEYADDMWYYLQQYCQGYGFYAKKRAAVRWRVIVAEGYLNARDLTTAYCVHYNLAKKALHPILLYAATY